MRVVLAATIALSVLAIMWTAIALALIVFGVAL